MTPVTLLTLTVATGTGTATYRYADVQTDAYPAYVPRLARGADLEEAAASPLTRSLPVRRARVRLSNVALSAYVTTAPTVSQILGAGHDVVGAQASVQVADADTQTVLTTLAGYVEEIPALSLTEATLVVSDALAGDASTLLPCALTDLFPSVQAPEGTALAVICGPARRVRLYPVSQADVLKATFRVAARTTRRRINRNYSANGVFAAAGDQFVYEIWREQPEDDVYLNMRVRTGPNVDADAWIDQNGLANNAYEGALLGCMGWYRRVFTLPAAAVGLELNSWRLQYRSGPGDAYTGTVRFARAALLDAAGNVKYPFIGKDFELTTQEWVQPFGTTDTVTPAIDPDAGYSFGAWRTGTGVAVANAYLNGRRMAPSEYAVVSPLPDVSAIKLTETPGDGAVVHADFTSTEFTENPARVARFFLSDAHHGLGRTVEETKFTAAATALTTRRIKVGGAVTRQTHAAELLREFLLHGAVLTHSAAGTIGIEVDAPGTQAALELGHNDDTGWRNFTPTNAAPVRAADQTRSLLVRGVFDPGFEGEPERWLATTKRSRTAPRGADREVAYRYVADAASLDRQAHYLWQQMRAWAARLTGDLDVTEPGAYGLNVGNRLTVTVPGLGLARADYRLAAFQNRGAKLSLTLHPYRAAAFVYAAGTDQTIDPLAHTLIDYSRTRPAAPTITTATANAPVALPDNREEITISATATAPAANVEALVFRAVRTGSAVKTDEGVVACTPGQTGVSATLKVDPKLTYTIQVYARNQTNDPGFQLSLAATRSVTSLGTPRIGHAVWHVGTGAPASTLGANGDFYLRTDTNTVYQKSNGTWMQVADLRGADGATWSTGSANPTGGRNGDWYFKTTDASIWRKINGTWTRLLDIDGADGATWHSGSGAPSGSLGKVGDWYFRTSNGYVYKKTGSSTWTFQRDVTGPQGPRGIAGATWHQGRGIPGNSLGNNGDFYLRTSNGDVYQKSGGSWGRAIANLHGADGGRWTTGSGAPNTASGSNGDWYFRTSDASIWRKSAGTWTKLLDIDGADGATWHSGSGAPSGSLGKVGDWYFRTSNGYVYKKTASGWTFQQDITGPQGPRSLPGFSNSIELRGYDLTPGSNWSGLTGWSTSPLLTSSAWPSSIRWGMAVVVSTADRKLMARVEAGASIAIARDDDNFGIYRTTGFYGPRSTVGSFNNLTLISSAGTAGFRAGSSGRLYFTPQGTPGPPGTPAKIVIGRAVVETNQETVGTGTLQMCNTSITNIPANAIVFISFSATLTFSSAIQNQDLTLVLRIGRTRAVLKQQAVRLGTNTGSFRSNGSAIVGISRAFVVGEGAGTYTMYAGAKKSTRQTGTFRIDEKELQILIFEP